MTEPVLVKIGYVVAAIFAYELLRWCMALATHKFRVRVGREADRWAQDPRLPPNIRETLAALADMAYWPSAPWRMLLLLAAGQFSMIAGMICAIFTWRSQPDGSGISDDDEVIAKIIRIELRLAAALITTGPLASVLAIAMLAVGAALGFALLGLRQVAGRRPAASARSAAVGFAALGSMRAVAFYIAAAGDRFVPRAGYSRAA